MNCFFQLLRKPKQTTRYGFAAGVARNKRDEGNREEQGGNRRTQRNRVEQGGGEEEQG